MDKAKRKGHDNTESGSDLEAKTDSKEHGGGRVWTREDGAICIENECVIIQSSKDGTVEFTVDPNKCSCEGNIVGDALYKAILGGALSGKGSKVTIKPKVE